MKSALPLPRLALCLPVLLLFSTPAGAEPSRYTLAIVPNRLPLVVHEDWSPLVERLSRRLNVHIEIRAQQTFPRFESEMHEGLPDFAFMNPYHVVTGHRSPGYIPLVRSRHPLKGILVVRRDSPIASVKDLEDRLLVFPSANAFGASLFLRAQLTERFKLKFTPYYVDAHKEVYRHVILDQAAAGGGTFQTFEREPAELRAQLRVLYETPQTVPHCLAAHPRVPAAVREAVIREILDMAASESDRKLLDPVQLTDPVRADYARDYAPLGRLGLERYLAHND
jgi:phosphonate transport system substrate-binding protein